MIPWRTAVGNGFASPVVAKGRVFLFDAELTRPAKERLHCFEESTGKPLWTFAYGVVYGDYAYNPEQSGGPTATPIVEAGKIYTVGGNGHVHCLDTEKGGVLWENDLGKTYQIRELQCRPSPLIEGDLLIVVTGAQAGACVVALDKGTGNEVWKALEDSVLNCSPMVFTVGKRRQLIVWSGEAVTSLNPLTGETYWRERLITNTNYGTSTPVFQNNRLLIAGLMLELSTGDTPTATILWPDTKALAKRILSNTSTALFRDDCIYSARGKGELVCLEAATGKQLWQVDTITEPKKGACIHIVPTSDATYLFTDEGNLICAELTPTGYHEISRAHLIDPAFPFEGKLRAYAAPALANGHIFVRSEKELVCASLIARP
ncbi:MAG: PQQ-binding-like beta-propeller repeat protein [Prosthecobacter sp.]|nr:PQQ-binding-like beta-propeller repeat protein [Prosthecobacter sp.]